MRKKELHGSKIAKNIKISTAILKMLKEPDTSLKEIIKRLDDKYNYKVAFPTLKGYIDNYVKNIKKEEIINKDLLEEIEDEELKKIMTSSKITIEYIRTNKKKITNAIKFLEKKVEGKSISGTEFNTYNQLLRTDLIYTDKLYKLSESNIEKETVKIILKKIALFIKEDILDLIPGKKQDEAIKRTLKKIEEIEIEHS